MVDRKAVEHATWAFGLHWGNDEPLYRAVLAYASAAMGRVPMSNQTLGRNVIDNVQRWCAQGYVSSLGFGPLHYPMPVDPHVLAMMRKEVGNFRLVDEVEIGEDVREALANES